MYVPSFDGTLGASVAATCFVCGPTFAGATIESCQPPTAMTSNAAAKAAHDKILPCRQSLPLLLPTGLCVEACTIRGSDATAAIVPAAIAGAMSAPAKLTGRCWLLRTANMIRLCNSSEKAGRCLKRSAAQLLGQTIIVSKTFKHMQFVRH